MIRRVWFEEYRALRRVEVPLERLTVLVGPNGSGKTSLLEGIGLLMEAGRGFPVNVFSKRWSIDRARRADANRRTVLGAEFEGCDPPDQFSVRLRIGDRTGMNQPDVVGSLKARSGGREAETKEDNGGGHLGNLGEPFSALREAIPSAWHLRLDAASLAAAAYSTEEVPRLDKSGGGLASVIADLATRTPEVLAQIADAARAVVPGLLRVRATRAQVERVEWDHVVVNDRAINVPRTQTYWGHRVVVDMTSGSEIPLSAAGEGTALAVGLMTFLHAADDVGLLLLDDLDRALHPKAQQDLVRVLREVMRQRPDLQVIATTHSPFVLNELEYSEVRLMVLSEDGAALVGPLSDHPDYSRWKDHVKPGELWTSDLEDWLKNRQSEAAE